MRLNKKYNTHGLIITRVWTNKIAWNNLQFAFKMLVSTVYDLWAFAKACLSELYWACCSVSNHFLFHESSLLSVESFFFFFPHICTKMDEKLVSFSMKLQLSSSISDELLKLDFGEVCSRDTSLKWECHVTGEVRLIQQYLQKAEVCSYIANQLSVWNRNPCKA